MRHLPRRLHGLQRRSPGSQESERNGRSVERRPLGQHSGSTLVVQFGKGINPNGRLTADQSSGGDEPHEISFLLRCNVPDVCVGVLSDPITPSREWVNALVCSSKVRLSRQ
jgi:hypothetical protein